MKYTVYYNGNKCKVYNDDTYYNVFQYVKGKHIWPEDNTEITFSYINGVLNYSLSNMSDRTKYLLENGLLGLGIFVLENAHSKAYFKSGRSTQSILRHPKRKWQGRCWAVTSATGSISVGQMPISSTLNTIFSASAQWQDPYRDDGYDDFYIGIGRYDDRTDVGFRPHKISEDHIRLWFDNDN